MTIQGLSNVSAAYAAMRTSPVQRQTFPSPSANYADRVSISDAAKAMMARSKSSAEDQEIQNRLAAIKARPAVERTPEDTEYLSKHDKRYVELLDKVKASGMNGLDALTADELDYMQKAGGMVNTMAELSPKEKALYDELVAKGKHEAANGLQLVGMSRIGMHGQRVTLPNGRSFDPVSTEVTAANIRNLFKHMFVDSDSSGSTDRPFEALASYLEQRGTSDQAASKA